MNGTDSSFQHTEFGHAMKKHFLFDSNWTNLNHGSFGTYPRQVRDALRAYQDQTEAAPDRFLFNEYTELWDRAREGVAELLHAPVDECVFVPNATTGVSTVLRNLTWQPKDAIIYFDTVYSAIEKGLYSLLDTHPDIHLRKVTDGPNCDYSLPASHAEILNAFSQTISRLLYDGYKPRIAIFDTIISLPGVRLPFERMVKVCKEYGILSLIDGAHGIGHIPINLTELDPDFFVSNCHKWLYTPRGSAVFFVPKRNQHMIRTTLPTSHGYNPPAKYKIRRVLPPSKNSDFVNLFQFIGTLDSSPFYCVPAALRFRAEVCGGDEAIYRYICDIAQRGADRLASILGTKVMDELEAEERSKLDEAIRWRGLRDCALANVQLPLTIAETATSTNSNFAIVKRDEVQKHVDWIHNTLTFDFNTRVLVYEYKGSVWTRVSGQIYLELKDFEWLGGVLKELCERVGKGESLNGYQNQYTMARAELDLEMVQNGLEGTRLESQH